MAQTLKLETRGKFISVVSVSVCLKNLILLGTVVHFSLSLSFPENSEWECCILPMVWAKLYASFSLPQCFAMFK